MTGSGCDEVKKEFIFPYWNVFSLSGNVIFIYTRILSLLILAFRVRGTDGRGDDTCFKGIGGSRELWHAQGDLGDDGAFASNTKLFRSQV